jgi:hypothetical protein
LTVSALSQQNVSVQWKDGSVLVNGEGNTNSAKVVVADILYNNGVVHVIDTVLLPKLNSITTTNTPKITNSATSATIGTLFYFVLLPF